MTLKVGSSFRPVAGEDHLPRWLQSAPQYGGHTTQLYGRDKRIPTTWSVDGHVELIRRLIVYFRSGNLIFLNDSLHCIYQCMYQWYMISESSCGSIRIFLTLQVES